MFVLFHQITSGSISLIYWAVERNFKGNSKLKVGIYFIDVASLRSVPIRSKRPHLFTWIKQFVGIWKIWYIQASKTLYIFSRLDRCWLCSVYPRGNVLDLYPERWCALKCVQEGVEAVKRTHKITSVLVCCTLVVLSRYISIRPDKEEAAWLPGREIQSVAFR